MAKVTAILSLLLISFTAQAKFINNLGALDMYPQEVKKLEILQLILLNSADKAFAGTGRITLDTSLMEKKIYRQIDSRSMDMLLQEAATLVQAQGCSLTIESEMGQKLFSQVKFDDRGNIATIGDILPVLNTNINCP